MQLINMMLCPVWDYDMDISGVGKGGFPSFPQSPVMITFYTVELSNFVNIVPYH